MATLSNFDSHADELLIFVGHSNDAVTEAKSVCELERELQRELDRLIDVMNDPPQLKKIHFWEWNSDAKAQVGGQETIINPDLQRARIAIFVFKTRIGPVTWEEIDQCRSGSSECTHIIAVFPDQPPDPSTLKNRDNAANWLDLLDKKEKLTKDWAAPDSRAVLPVEDYRDCEHLKKIILDQVKRILGDILKPTCRAEPNANSLAHNLESAALPFIEQVTNVTSYDARTLSDYRKLLRDEARVQFPQALSDIEFLTKAGYLRNGGLTRAGVLLFNLTPETELPSAKARCVIYHGTAKKAARNRKDITGPVHNQIEQVYDFISSNVEKVELPKRGSLEASTTYRYPMNCIREVIANALCHRNYEDAQRMTYFRIFSDRIEVSNPGTWGAKPLGAAKVALGELGGESVPPNFRLAHGIASINRVEMEGSGIPTAVEDCETIGAPEPEVTERDGYVVVTIFPKDNWRQEIKRMTLDSSGEKSSKKPTVFISYSHKDEVWKDRLRPHLKMLEQAGEVTVWDDRSIDAGAAWYGEVSDAINQAAVAICLISSDYLASDFCVKEELPYLLERRERDGMVILPILIRPCSWKAMPWLKGIQTFPRGGRSIVQDYRGNEDEVFADVAETIFERLKNLPARAPKPSPQWQPPERVDVSCLPVTGAELFGRRKELEMLDEAWASNGLNVISLVAWGGVGKSTLVNKWLEGMQDDNYRGARRVYAWSFFSQGAGERVTSADQFINAALQWFGDADPTAGSPWDKGERLARLVQSERTLLLLDGLEPLQSSHSHERGKISDPALVTLLLELARYNPGLCVITTREPVSDLAEFEDTVLHKDLEQISDEAGRALLRVGGVQGTDAELEQATRDFGNHALAINLLAVYLRDVPGHHISYAAGIPDLDIPEEFGRHPRRLMAAFAQRFGDGPEVGLLRVLGFFDRPADSESLDSLRAGPPIPHLTEHLHGLSEADWLRLIEKLRWTKLIAPAGYHRLTSLDANPLVREHFGQELRQRHPIAWREGNNRLYEHLKRTTKEFPETLEEMTPLYAAVTHGCAAGRHREALDEVFYRRIIRGEEFFSIRRLGAYGAELAALVSFFDPPWQKPVPELSDVWKAFILGYAGFCLRALGRLAEAVQPLQAGLEARVSLEDWENASTSAGNLSELYLTLGDLRQAVAYAEKSRELADKSGASFRRMVGETKLANALSQAGRLAEAEAAFRRAELMQKDDQPQYPLLYSLPGFQYCDLLLEQGKYEEVESRASQALQVAKRNLGLLDIALDLLSLGRAYPLRAREGKTGDYAQATEHLNQAVDGLRMAGTVEFLSRGLLARAELNIAKGDFSRARADLDEAMSIAVRGEMRLYEADCHLGYARLFMAQGEMEQARESLAKAKEMIERMGYGRREKDVEEIERLLGEMGVE